MNRRSILLLLLSGGSWGQLLLTVWTFGRKHEAWGDELVLLVMLMVPTFLLLFTLRSRLGRDSVYVPGPYVLLLISLGIFVGVVGIVISSVTSGHLDTYPMLFGIYLEFGALLLLWLDVRKQSGGVSEKS